MKIAILNITFGSMSRGYEKYLRNILPRLHAHPQISSLLVGLPKKVKVSNWESEFPYIHWMSLEPRFWIGRFLDSNKIDIIKKFNPNILFIPSLFYWNLDRVPTVIMIQNMEPMVHIQKNPYFEKIINWGRYRYAYASTMKADRIISVSKFVKDFLITKWKINPDKIGMAYHGIGSLGHSDFQKPTFVPESWKDKFLFTAGSIRPARGLEDLLYAANYLKKFNNNKGLVIAGDVTPRMSIYKKKLEEWINANNLSTRISWTGSLNETEMAWCYQNCSLFIMTSRVEACPNIALEAMSYGCINISTDNPPMPEIFREAAIFYPHGNHEILAKQILDMLKAPEEIKKKMRRHSLERASHFNWDECARQTVHELRKAIEGFRG